MDEYESLSHSKWECKYHVVLIREYIRNQEQADQRVDQMNLWK